MPIHTWITRAPRPFDSLYCYNTHTRNLACIRLELRRQGPNPDPAIITRRNSYIGFVDADTQTQLRYRETSRWTIDQRTGQILYSFDHNLMFRLSMIPTNTEIYIVDFPLEAGRIHPRAVYHDDNPISAQGHFPGSGDDTRVDRDMLQHIATHYLGSSLCHKLCAAEATEEELGEALTRLYHHISGKKSLIRY